MNSEQLTDNGDSLTLVIDTSSKSAAVGLFCGEQARAEGFLLAGLTHSQTLGPMLDSVLAHLGAEKVSRVAVTNGPGSFTGLRIGVSAALGYALACGAQVAGVSSLEAAAQNAAFMGGADGVTVCAVMDARRGQVYAAEFWASGGTLTRLGEDRAVPAEEIIAANAKKCVIYVGDGAALCYNDEKDILIPEIQYIRSAGIMRCVLAGHTRPAEKLCYLRLPQAERERIEKSAPPEQGG
ncbi:MAG: tRNA (adenosine(37)-N6)-threonylcarbamoyltransferase complex dimerization subunit type 1 TsaB [Oscillospiraceae bacterium]|nr:tRNA (adenosine(37)-N6)-threonylcarbamoyltransferase complex dimerization subunit type 1 TsaB [Oscillospiraceae bacterium]